LSAFVGCINRDGNVTVGVPPQKSKVMESVGTGKIRGNTQVVFGSTRSQRAAQYPIIFLLVFAPNVSGLNAAPCKKLLLTTAFDWGCVLALVMCCKIYGL